MTKEETIVINKKEAMSNFFSFYSKQIDNSLRSMSKDELEDYLDNDIYINWASDVTEVPEHEFVKFALVYFRKN